MRKGLEATAALWPPVRLAYGYVRKAAGILANKAGLPGKGVRRRLLALLRRMRAEAKRGGEAAAGLSHFTKVSASYLPGLFACYAVADVPRTNNGLEQLFGSHRYHERRSSGRKVASPGLVVRGSVRLVAGVATRQESLTGAELAPADPQQWQEVRRRLVQRRQARVLQRRFRREPQAFLTDLEAKMPQSGLPS